MGRDRDAVQPNGRNSKKSGRSHEAGGGGLITYEKEETVKRPGCRKRGRPQLRWQDYVKRGVRKAGDKNEGRRLPAWRSGMG